MRKERTPDRLEALWKEKDMSNGRPVDAMVMIIRTNGCSWARTGGCTMCGYRSASLSGVTEDDLLAQLDQALGRYSGEPFVKMYTSGSFLDEREIPARVRDRYFDAFSGCERILFESRPEFVTPDALSTAPASSTLALGLEACDPEVLRVCVNKGFTPEQCRAAGAMAKDAGLDVRTYLLLKPLYLQEAAAIDCAVESVRFADPFSDEISVNPVNVQKGTAVERAWRRGDYRPPFIWSLIEVMKRCAGTVGARLMSSPSGGGTQRGVHNCGECDRAALEAVERFSFSQDPADLEVSCPCRRLWKDYMEAESLLGSPADMERGLCSDLAVGRR